MPRIFNKGKRPIKFGASALLMPSRTAPMDADVAAKLMALYPNELVDLDDKGSLEAQFQEAPEKKEVKMIAEDVAEKEKKEAVDAALGVAPKQKKETLGKREY